MAFYGLALLSCGGIWLGPLLPEAPKMPEGLSLIEQAEWKAKQPPEPSPKIPPNRIVRGAIAYSYVDSEFKDPAAVEAGVDGPPDEICCPPCALRRHGVDVRFELIRGAAA